MLREFALQDAYRNTISQYSLVDRSSGSASNPGDAPSSEAVISNDGAKGVARALRQLLVKRRVSVLPDSV